VAAAAVALTMLGAPSARAEGRGDIRIIKTVVDGGTNVIVGVSKPVTFPIRMTVKDNDGSRVSTASAPSTRTTAAGRWSGSIRAV